MARTKIVATIGPASNKPEVIRKMLAAGMNVARINFSHGDHEAHTTTVKLLREIAAAEGKVLALLGDLQGPKLRLGHVRAKGISLNVGDEIVLTAHPGQPAMIHLPHPDLIAAVQPGARLVIGDGEVEFQVAHKKPDTLYCVVTVAGLLEARKGISAPGTELPISSIPEKDIQDLDLICRLELDYVALSFVRNAEDILELRRMLKERGVSIPIIAKIEKSEAIEHLDDILAVTDGMMVARGDLGIDMPPQQVPLLQKRIVRACNRAGKPVITATQMLQSMVEHPRPTRAEASDVANAILDGTDAVMLSGETASGKFPVEAVQMMRHIAEITESDFPYDTWRRRRQETESEIATVTEAISASSCAISEEIKARAIVSSTMSGYTAQQIARHRPKTPVLAVSPLVRTQRRLALVWGVECLLVSKMYVATDEMVDETVAALRPLGLHEGDRLVITAGIPFNQVGQTNLIQVYEVKK
ncbi:MAG: pyruvate kinase [Chloroflexi bacterium]|nr:pyruvate kinase [Chloroflexota bacterium]MBP8058857.1 pyruvate kinase [Chloroflexota bacterium]